MDETYLDVSTTLNDRDEAVAMAARYNQIAIYDLAAQWEIDTGGTGEATGDQTTADHSRRPASETDTGQSGNNNG